MPKATKNTAARTEDHGTDADADEDGVDGAPLCPCRSGMFANVLGAIPTEEARCSFEGAAQMSGGHWCFGVCRTGTNALVMLPAQCLATTFGD